MEKRKWKSRIPQRLKPPEIRRQSKVNFARLKKAGGRYKGNGKFKNNFKGAQLKLAATTANRRSG